MGRRKPPPPRSRSSAAEADASPPSLELLEQFSRASLSQWKATGRVLAALTHALFFGLENQRAESAGALVDAVRLGVTGPFEFHNWARIVDWRFSTAPLSLEGSVRGDGGRFNIGSTLNPAAYSPFPALYLAEDFETAYRERFGLTRTSTIGGLSAEEVTLRRLTSFTHVKLRGTVDGIVDIANPQALKAIVSVIARFKMPDNVLPMARALGLRPPGLIRTTSGLQRQLLHSNWRMQPSQYDLPANSQIFGRLCAGVGVHGILYPSAKDSSKRCLALFPQNWRASESFVEAVDTPPAQTGEVRLDGKSDLRSG
ncbi:MAG: RES family NAD+ phosphorylase [Betaproteobacteria bacterium]